MKKLINILFLLFTTSTSYCQQGYTVGQSVNNFKITLSLNANASFKSLEDINGDIIILDFFGTWCIPCIKALSHLEALQKQFGSNISIVLISTEEKQRLIDFSNNRIPIKFPIIVDTEQEITPLFQPPSYPYSVVLNKQRQILSISNAGTLTATSIEQWLAAKPKSDTVINNFFTTKQIPDSTTNKQTGASAINRTNNEVVKLSQDFIYAAKTGNNATKFIEEIASINYDSLKASLTNDNTKKAFWINIYNGFTQYFLRNNPSVYENRGKFFSAKQITIANKLFSLDDIEHGILRKSKIKWSEGYINKWLPSKVEKELRVDVLDFRIHFALNCGAQSCPPIAFYTDETIDKQLAVATKAYLTAEATYNVANNTLSLPKLMSWFRHDFKGKRNMTLLAKNQGLIPENISPTIMFKPYSWQLYLNNYKTN